MRRTTRLVIGGELVRYNIAKPFAFDLRPLLYPALGTSVHHIPGAGRTIGGVTEAIIDSPMRDDTSNVVMQILEGWPR